MSDALFMLFPVVLFLGALIWKRYSDRAAAERHRQLTDWASARGWNYRPTDGALATRWNGPPFIGGGAVRDVFSGEVGGWPFTVFEYRYEEGSGDNSVTRYFTVTAVRLPAELPMLWIAPETAFRRLAQRLGSQDIDFESAEFNRSFAVRADDDRYAHAVVHPRMMEYLLNSPARGQSVRIEGNTLLMWESASLSTGSVLTNSGTLAQVAALIPSHALQQYALSAAPDPAQRPRRYAGSVTGLRPEPNLRGLLGPIGMLAWGFFWCLITTPVGIAVISLWINGTQLPHIGLLGLVGLLIPLIGVAGVGYGATKLVRGLVAIQLNKRDRDRRAMNLKPPTS